MNTKHALVAVAKIGRRKEGSITEPDPLQPPKLEHLVSQTLTDPTLFSKWTPRACCRMAEGAARAARIGAAARRRADIALLMRRTASEQTRQTAAATQDRSRADRRYGV